MKQLKVKEKAAAIVRDAEASQRVLDIAAYADPQEGIRQGLEDAKKGRYGSPESFSWTSKRSMAYLVNLTVRPDVILPTCFGS